MQSANRKISEENTTHPLSDLLQLIDAGDIAMLTTIGDNNRLSSRPMETCHINKEGELFFFSDLDKQLSEDLEIDTHVNLSYSFDNKHQYISVSGSVVMFNGDDELSNYWQDELTRWIPDGLSNPNLVLLKIIPLKAECWKENTKLEQMTKSILLGEITPPKSHTVMKN